MKVWFAKIKIIFYHRFSYFYNLVTKFCHYKAKEKSREVVLQSMANFSEIIINKQINNI